MDRNPESYLRDVVNDHVNSVLDVGTGLSGVFDFWNWEKKNLRLKGCVYVFSIRRDIPGWFKIIANAGYLPFRDETFDVVQSTEMLEHVKPEGWQQVLDELSRVSRDTVYVTTSDQAFPNEELFVKNGFHILFISPHHIIAFKRKIPEWNSTFKDMDTYVRELCKDLEIESVIDVGTGLKGVVAQHFWENEKHIRYGYAVDIWKIKPLPSSWQPMRIDALTLENYFPPKSVDVLQAFGFLEHLKKEDGFKFLHIAEKIARKLVIISAATFVHGATRDYKVKKDGNPYHYYHSTWHWKEFEALGYQSNFEDMRKGISFSGEAIAWKKLWFQSS